MQNNNQNQIFSAIVIAGVLIAGAILLKGNTAPVNLSESTDKQIDQVVTNARAVSPDEHILGDINAPIVIVEYSDMECPFCKRFHLVLQSVLEKNNGNVAWVYRHYPIPQLHSKATREAGATECAWEQGGNNTFWKYLDRIMEITPSNNGLEEKELSDTANYIGIDSKSFNTCLDSGKYIDKVQADINDGLNAGALGTPYNLIITRKDISSKVQTEITKTLNAPGAVSFDKENKKVMIMNGALPEAMVDQIIEILLK